MSIKGKFKHYHQYLFEWHCENFFPFANHFTYNEMNYLNICFDLAQDYVEVSDLGYDNFSYYSYSHRINENSVNSSRLAFGSVANPEECFVAAQPVLKEKNINLVNLFPQYPEYRFYGLGWDILNKHFKIYWRVPDIKKVTKPFLDLVNQTSAYAMAEGLVAITIQNGELFERKIYRYPGEKVEMLTSNRGLVEQYDTNGDTMLWLKRINNAGIEIVRKYQTINEDLDTISLIDRNHYTLYFP